jgi:hypothetical protein
MLVLLLLLLELCQSRPSGSTLYGGHTVHQPTFFQTMGFDDIEVSPHSSLHWPWQQLGTRYQGYRFWRQNSALTGYASNRLPVMNVSASQTQLDLYRHHVNKARSWPNIIFTSGEKLLVSRGQQPFSVHAFYASPVFLGEMFIQIDGYRNKQLLHSRVARITQQEPTAVQLDWRHIDRLVVQCHEPLDKERCSHVAYDDFVFYR